MGWIRIECPPGSPLDDDITRRLNAEADRLDPLAEAAWFDPIPTRSFVSNGEQSAPERISQADEIGE